MRDRQHAKLTAVKKVEPQRAQEFKEHRAALCAGPAQGVHQGPEPWGLDETDAAKFLGLSPRTLQRMRLEGTSPPYSLVGKKRVRFPLDGLRAWLNARVVHSTSEATVRRQAGTL